MNLNQTYQHVRSHTENICAPLEEGDYLSQPIEDVSPPKWHLGHSTWFFETFVLKPHLADYSPYHERFSFIFNSYYEHAGERIQRFSRGNLTRPSVSEVYSYRKHVDQHMDRLIASKQGDRTFQDLVILGLNHEQQHQELLFSDIKYILSQNPLNPVYSEKWEGAGKETEGKDFVAIEEGVYTIGFQGEGFHFDNELGVHKVYLQHAHIQNGLVTSGEYLEFIEAGGYKDFRYWLSEAWAWVQENKIQAPLYWHHSKEGWVRYSLKGVVPINPMEPVSHISFFEADAFANWAGKRLPTEFEWEVASPKLSYGKAWEWTASAYLPYPGFEKAPGALGEYNGKFMVNQMVLRGGSVATSSGHSRPTYRNFFHPDKRWQFTGIRLAE
ncbi:MAG: ergothioneine biosynthesis protein EgtB [Bacteroidota bacterium]